jgi:DNA-binding SARP family transcriptional activator
VNFQILGPLLVTDDDDRELGLGGAKPAALLAILILHANEVVSSDRLIEEIWDEHPPPTAPKSLQVHVSRLRRALGNGRGPDGGPVVTRGGGYLLNASPEQIDSMRFESLVNEGREALEEGAHARASARLRAALGLWRGGALADFAYASFAQDAIARLEGLRMVAFERVADAELALGRHAELIPELKSLVRANPLSERLRAQLMLALYRAGRQAEALGVYRAGRRVLVDQLGIEPGAELRELEHAILAQDPKLAAPEPERRPQRQRLEPQTGALLVGYERELSSLEDVLEEALAGQDRLALISGEPGIGKTRLADELANVARARGAQVVWGRCWQGGGAPAYWPWIQVLRALGHDLVPEATGADVDVQEARFRLYDTTASVLRHAACAQPIVIVLDDLHAADQSTLTLLEFLTSAVISAPLLIVGTYRDTELSADHPFSEALAELGRGGEPTQLVLGGLSPEDTAHFVEVSAGVAPMPRLAAAIHTASGGNPLFVGELVRLLRAENRLRELDQGETLVLPRGIEQVITSRLQRLSEPCRRTLALAAVVGREFDTTVLGRAGDADGEQLLELLDEALSTRAIEDVPGSRGCMRFSHELVRHALYHGLGAVERRRLHLAAGRAMEQLQGAGQDAALPQLAHHFSEALPSGDAYTAIDYLARAGDRAAEMLAYEEAISLYTRALEIGRGAGADPRVFSELDVKLGEQLVLDGNVPRAEAALADAEAVMDGAPDPAQAGRIEIARAELDLFDACTLPDGRIQQVIAMFQDAGDPFGEARAWWALFSWHHGRSAMAASGEAARQMLECARRAGSKALADQAIRGMAAAAARGPSPMKQAIPRVRALLADATYPRTKARILIYLAELEGVCGRFDEARALFAESHSLLLKTEQAEIDACAAPSRARLELLAGNPRRAEEIERQSCAQLQRQGQTAILASELTTLVEALTAQGRLEEATAELERAAAILRLDDIDAIHRQARSRARIQVARGDLQGAEESMQTAIDYVFRQDMVEEQAESLILLAQIRLASGHPGETREAATEALRLSEARGHQPFAERSRELLSRVGGAPDTRAAPMLVDQ